MLYVCAAALLAGGATWWLQAAPREPTAAPSNPAIEQWTRSVQELLPAEPGQADGGTVTLAAGVEQEVQSDLESGSYRLVVICGGGVDSQVWVRFGGAGDDSGVGMPCTGARNPVELPVTVGDHLRLKVSVNNSGPVVFGYSILRA
jgi:hypothetical protein